MHFRGENDTQPMHEDAPDLEEGELEDGELDDDEPVLPVQATAVPLQQAKSELGSGKEFINITQIVDQIRLELSLRVIM